MSRSTRSRFLGVLFVLALVAVGLAGLAGTASAASLTWDANALGDGQPDGAGAWLDANQWWSGAANQDWVSGSDANFGNGGVGGAVTLASPTSVGLLTFNSFTGTYTLGTAGQAITLNTGITMNLGAGDVTIVSPITLGGPQSWTNNSAGLLTVGTDAVVNGANLLTIGGTGNTAISGVIGGGAGGITKNGSGTLTLSNANTYTGATTVKAGTLALGAAGTIANSTTITVGDAGSGGTVLDLTSKTGGFSILSGQTLKGIGTVNIGAGLTLTVDAGGRWAPGNSIGTNAVTGNLTLSGDSDFELGAPGASHAAPGTSDRTDVSGALTLGGTLNLINNANANGLGSAGLGFYKIFTYATTLSGFFTGITNVTGYHAKVVDGGAGAGSGQGVFLDNYQLAVANAISGAIGNYHVGAAKPLTLQNMATAGNYSEDLDATLTAGTNTAGSSGSVTDLIAGGTNSTGLLVKLGGSGVQTGDVTIALTSTGKVGGVSNGLGTTSLASQLVSISGTGYNLAVATRDPATLDFVNYHVGDTSTPQAISLTNTAPADGYSEKLDATIGGSAGLITAGSVSLLAAGDPANTDMTVKIDTSSLGAKAGTATLGLTSNGLGTSGLGTTALADQTVSVTGGSVFALAATSSLPTTVNLPNVHTGGTFGTQAVAISNTGAGGASYTEGLNATAGTATGQASSNSGSFTDLRVGADPNSSIVVGLSDSTYTGTAGLVTGTVPVTLTSNGTISGLAPTGLTGKDITVNGGVYDLAVANAISGAIGNYHVGAAKPLTLQNTATAGNYSEDLDATLTAGTNTAGSSGSVTDLIAGGTNSTGLLVKLGGSGVQTGDVTIALTSTGKVGGVSNGLGTTSLAPQLVSISGTGYNLAEATRDPATLNFVNYHVGDTSTPQAISLTNTAPADGFSEKLDATIGGSAGLITAGSVSLLAVGDPANTNMTVKIDTSSAGAKAGTATLGLTSNGSGTSELGTTALADQTVTITGGSVYNLAAANTIANPMSIFAHRTGTFGTPLTITNTAPVGFSEGLDATQGAVTGNAILSGTDISNLSGGSSSTTISVGLTGVSTATLGSAGTGTATIAFASNGLGTSGLTSTTLASQTFTVNGSVYSGLSTWIGGDPNYWGTLSSGFGANWGVNQGSPGLDPAFAGVDTATLGTTTGTVTVNLDGAAPSLNALTFNGLGTYTLAKGTGSGSLTLAGTAPTITSSATTGTQTISAPVTLDANTTVSAATGGTLAISGAIGGSSTGLTKTGAGTLTLSGANGYTGATIINAGTITVSGAAGAIASTVIALNGGGLTLDNSSTTGGNLGTRVSDSAAINVNGNSALSFVNNAAASTSYAETIDTLAPQSGFLTYTGSRAASGQTSSLNFNTLSRSGTATVDFAGASLGADLRNTIKFGAGVANGVDLGPWAVVNGVDFATYDSTLGVKALTSSALAVNSNSSTTNFKLSANITFNASLTPSLKTLLVSGNTARTLAISGNTVSVGGISISGNKEHIISGSGAVQALAAGDPLYINVSGKGLAISSVIQNVGAGLTSSALVKSGEGTLTLSGVNTYSGGTVINAGTLAAAFDTNLGSGGGITFNGSATFNPGTAAVSFTRSITINNYATATFGRADGTATFLAGSDLTGNGGIRMASSYTTEVIFNGTGNTFEGKISIGADGTGAEAYRFAFASLADSVTANGRIVFALKGASAVSGSNGSVFEYTGDSNTPLVLNNRQIELASVANPSNGHQIRRTGAGTLTVNTDLIVSTNVAQTLALNGANTTGNNTFAGKIGDGSGALAIVSLLKGDAGLWILSGANTYTGTTTVAQGTLSINTIKDFGSSSAIGAPTSGAIQLGVGSNSGTLAYTGADDSTNRTFQIGNATAANTGGGTISNDGSGALTFTATTFNNTIAGITATRTLTLGGTYVDGSNKIQGIIQDNVSTTGKVAITKSGAGTWVLTGANAYTGATTISGGKLLLGQGGSMGASAVSVTGTATYGMARTTSGDGVQGGSTLSLDANTTLNLQDGYTNTLGFGSTGTLSGAGLYFDLGATTADKVELAGAATVTNTNTFYFNVLGGTPKTGDHAYMLITAGSGLSTGGTFAISTTLSEYNLALDTQADAVYLNVTLKRLPGDTNEDKVVDAADYITVKQNFGMTSGALWKDGNFDEGIDGNVDWDDLQILMANFGKGSLSAPATNTPEPATLGLLAIGALALLRRRRK